VAGERAPLSAAAGAALQARLRTAQVEVPGDFAIGVRNGGLGGSCDGNGIAKVVMDMAGPEAHCEQAERGHQATAVHAEQLVLVDDSQLEGACRLDARDEVDDSIEVGKQFPSEPVTTRARYLPPSPCFYSAKKVDP
jgi:hypothetical protein